MRKDFNKYKTFPLTAYFESFVKSKPGSTRSKRFLKSVKMVYAGLLSSMLLKTSSGQIEICNVSDFYRKPYWDTRNAPGK